MFEPEFLFDKNLAIDYDPKALLGSSLHFSIGELNVLSAQSFGFLN